MTPAGEPTDTFPRREEVRAPGLLIAVVALTALPSVLQLLGIDLGTPEAVGSPAVRQLLQDTARNPSADFTGVLYDNLSGSFVHTVLEAIGFCAALFTVVLALLHYDVRRDAATPVIGAALFSAGTLDAFHALAVDRIVLGHSEHFAAFTWLAGRMFHGLIVIVGAGIVLARPTPPRERDVRFVLSGTVLFALLALVVALVAAEADTLPTTRFPDSLIPRPWDLLPLGLFLIAGLLVYPRLHRRGPSYFTTALMASAIPAVVAQIHVAFGSTAAYDHHFVAAHLLKILAYGIPCVGLVMDYRTTYREKAQLIARLERARLDLVERSLQLERANVALTRKNAELDEFTYIASHDLQEPLRKVTSFAGLLEKDLGGALPENAKKDLFFITDAATRMARLIDALLDLSRAGRSKMTPVRVRLDACVDRALDALHVRLQETDARTYRDPLPEAWGDEELLAQVFQNLISNALKFMPPGERPVVRVTAEKQDSGWVIGVLDNGIGIDPKHAKRIFSPFARLHGKDKYEGSGIGLALCRKTIERHHGRIWVEPAPEGRGSHFRFTLEEPA